MRHLTLTAVFALLSVLLGVWVAQANPYQEGNPFDWSPPPPVDLLLHQNLIGSVSQPSNPIDVCSAQFPTTAWMVPDRWNSQLGFTAFQFRLECDGQHDAEILTTQTIEEFEQFCISRNYHACVHPTQIDWAEFDLQQAQVVLNPNMPWLDGNDPHTLRDVVHELGHVLGMGEYTGCAPGSQLTVMDWTEDCPGLGETGYGFPQTIDVTNYHFLYHADHVQNLAAGTPSPGTVVLNWSQTIPGDPYGRSIPNEKSFGIWRGSTPVTAVPKNYQSVTLTAQPPGSQTYYVYSDSDADPWGDQSYASVNVNVTAPPLGRVSGFKIDAYTGGTQMKVSWDSLSGATGYKLCVSTQPNSGWLCDRDMGNVTTGYVPIPSGQNVYFYSVIGYNASYESTLHSNRGVFSRFTDSTYKSYHTAYKTSSGTKKVNGFNKRSSGSLYLAFRAGSYYKTSGAVSANSRWSASALSWTDPDENTYYGPMIRPLASQSSSLSPRAETAASTLCMVISGDDCN